MEGLLIRRYKKEDRGAIRNIAWETAFRGEPASIFFADKEIVADFLTQYFTDYEPESCFVAEKDGEILGYIFGSQNINSLKRIFFFKILPRIILKAIFRGTLFCKKNFLFIFYLLRSLLRREFKMPDFSKEYPANLHINMRKKFRKLGIGKMLMEKYLNYLKENKVKGIHLATFSEEAKRFFEREGFKLLFKGRRSYFRRILGKDILVYIYGKKIF